MRAVCTIPCNLAAKESGLECTCVNNDDFTVLVSGDGRRPWVSICTVWLLHSKWLSEYSNECASIFHSSMETIWMIQRAIAKGNWWLPASSRQNTCSRFMSYAVFLQNIKSPGKSAPLYPRFGTLWLLAFPKTKITVEREEISDHWWDSGKYDRAAGQFQQRILQSVLSSGRDTGRTAWSPKVPTLKGTEASLS